MCEEGKDKKRQDKDHDRYRGGQRSSVCERVHESVHHEAEDPHTAHDDQIGNDRPEATFFCIFDPLI